MVNLMDNCATVHMNKAITNINFYPKLYFFKVVLDNNNGIYRLNKFEWISTVIVLLYFVFLQ